MKFRGIKIDERLFVGIEENYARNVYLSFLKSLHRASPSIKPWKINKYKQGALLYFLAAILQRLARVRESKRDRNARIVPIGSLATTRIAAEPKPQLAQNVSCTVKRAVDCVHTFFPRFFLFQNLLYALA